MFPACPLLQDTFLQTFDFSVFGTSGVNSINLVLGFLTVICIFSGCPRGKMMNLAPLSSLKTRCIWDPNSLILPPLLSPLKLLL